MKLEKPNIGLLIEQRMNELGINKSELARRCGIANQHINRVLSRESIDTGKLALISEALDYDFFACYRRGDAADGGGVAVSATGHSAVSLHGDAVVSSAPPVPAAGADAADAAVLAERVKALEALLAEKERLIRLYERMARG